MRIILIAFISSFITICTFSQKTIFHEYEETASDFRIIKWNINQNNLPRFYVQENVDRLGRVVELKFCENGKVAVDQLCYLDYWIKFQYPNDTTIITVSLDPKGNPGGSFECENPYKVTYHLSTNKRIILSTSEEYHIGDTAWYIKNGWTKEELEKGIQSLLSEQQTLQVIGGYIKSYSKLGGLFPISMDCDPQNYISNNPEGLEIEKALK